MQHRTMDGFGTSIPLYALGAIFLVPLSIGVLLVSSNADQNDQANQISRDIASMYAQGMDFSKSANQSIAERVAEGLGMSVENGQGVLILSKIRMVEASDCAAGSGCANQGHAVVTQRFVMGNAGLRRSSFGTPSHIDPATGNVIGWADDVSARAEDFHSKLSPGEFTYAAEFYALSRESRGGVYSRAMF
jgi:hypothetical protein